MYWQLYHIEGGYVHDLGVFSQAWLDEWSGRMFDNGWTLEPTPAPFYRLVKEGEPRSFEVYRSTHE